MTRTATALVLCAALLAPTAHGAEGAAEAKANKPLIQLAILLDTSNSMDGLIAQAKTQLWQIVNEFATAKREGQVPELQVGLYEYGKSSIPRGEGHLRMVLPLTTDLDKVSEQLFALTTRGGQEYCGMVIQTATDSLAWSKSNDDLKVIVIAGNEPFTQGSVDYRQACKGAITKGIIINTIHCGSHKAGVQGKWKDGAVLADGTYLNIDQSRVTHHVRAPQDKRIAELNVALNKTYVPYGRAGKEGGARQKEQDALATKASAAAGVQRMVAKASVHYHNVGWDLVDALKDGRVKLGDVKKEDLPAEMQKMTPVEQKAHLEGRAKDRLKIQKEIRTLNEARKKHVAAEMKKHAKGEAKTLGGALLAPMRKQAEKRGFKLK